MSLAEEVNKYLGQWGSYCMRSDKRYSTKITDCDAFNQLVRRGPMILPYILEAYQKSALSLAIIDNGLPDLVSEVAPDFRRVMEERGKYDIKFLIKWLEDNCMRIAGKP